MARPWPTTDATTSLIMRLSAWKSAPKPDCLVSKGRNSLSWPSHSFRYRWSPLSDACMPTTTSASCTAAQNGSNSGSANDGDDR